MPGARTIRSAFTAMPLGITHAISTPPAVSRTTKSTEVTGVVASSVRAEYMCHVVTGSAWRMYATQIVSSPVDATSGCMMKAESERDPASSGLVHSVPVQALVSGSNRVTLKIFVFTQTARGSARGFLLIESHVWVVSLDATGSLIRTGVLHA